MFNGKDCPQTEPWVASFKAYLQVNKKLFDDDERKTDTPTYGSPDVTYNDKDSLSRVLIVVTVVPKCTLRGLGLLITQPPQLGMLTKRDSKMEGIFEFSALSMQI
jgi:hypothetical protein